MMSVYHFKRTIRVIIFSCLCYFSSSMWIFISLVLRFMLDHSVYTILQLIGVPDRAEKDEVVKAVMSLKNTEIEEGYTMDVVASRQV